MERQGLILFMTVLLLLIVIIISLLRLNYIEKNKECRGDGVTDTYLFVGNHISLTPVGKTTSSHTTYPV